MELYDFQSRMVRQATAFLRDGENIVLRAPTGSGKSVMAAHIIARLGRPSIVVSHSDSINNQWSADYGILAVHPTVFAKMTITEDTLVVLDEAHHYSSNRFTQIVAEKNVQVLGLTATPVRRRDDQGFDQLFTRIVDGPSYTDLVELGKLKSIVHVTPTSQVADTDGRKSAKAAADFFETNRSTDEVVTWIADNLESDDMTIVFTHSRKSALEIADRLNGRAVLSDMDSDVREQHTNLFKTGAIKVLTTVNALLEGTDLPMCNTVVLARPFRSLSAYLQAIGRATRPQGREYAKVLDYCCSVSIHGRADDDYRWRLTAKDAAETCPECESPGFAGYCFECGLLIKGKKPKLSGVTFTCQTCLNILTEKQVMNGGCRACSESGINGDMNDIENIVIGSVEFAIDGQTLTTNLGGHTVAWNLETNTITVTLGQVLGRQPKGFKNGQATFDKMNAVLRLLD